MLETIKNEGMRRLVVSRRYAQVTLETSTSFGRRTKTPPPPTSAADRPNSLWSINLLFSLELFIHALVSMLNTSSGPVRYMSQQHGKDE